MREWQLIRMEIEKESEKEKRLRSLIESARTAQDHIRHILLMEPICDVEDFGPEQHQTGRDMLNSLRMAEGAWRDQHDEVWMRLHELHSESLDQMARTERLLKEQRDKRYEPSITPPGPPPGWRVTPGPAFTDQWQSPATLPDNIKLVPTPMPHDTFQAPTTGQPSNRHMRGHASSP